VAGPTRHPLALAESTPPRLVPLINLINAHSIGGAADAFDSTASAESYLAESGFDVDAVRVTPAALRQLRSLRDALIAVIERPDDQSAWAEIDAIASRARLRLRFTAPGESELTTAASGVQAIVYQTIAILHNALADGTWSRLRLCALDVCHSAFYDATRSRTQRWHSYAMCGNRTNVAAYRAAHKH
jgi:predicted RNA-binding Zn ribbon-like protein